MRSARPSASYGCSRAATVNTTTSPATMPTRVPRTHQPSVGPASIGSGLRSIGGGTIATRKGESRATVGQLFRQVVDPRQRLLDASPIVFPLVLARVGRHANRVGGQAKASAP